MSETTQTAQAQTIVVERTGPVATLRLDRPGGMNSFDVETDERLLDQVRDLDADPDVRAVVVTGTGKFFCTGADVSEMRERKADAPLLFDELTLPYHAMLQTIKASDKTWVAAVNGIAAGGGVGFALSCDLVVVADAARFVLAYGNLGVSPDGGATAHLVRAIGPHRAREAVLIDDGITAQQAVDWGLANRVVPPGELMTAAVDLASKAAARAPHTVRKTKQLVERAAHSSFDAMLEAERRGIIQAAGTEDFQEGLDAFFTKRRPEFQGR